MAEARLLDASVGPPHAGVLSQTGSAAAASIGAGIGQPAILSSATFAVPISSAYGNINGVMHGAAAAVIYDMLTTCALGPLGRPGYWE